MPRLTLECVLMLGYAASLAVIAFLLELIARHAHRRSVRISTGGFTYHADLDIWRCPQDQHLFPVFSDPVKKVVVYRASASICNACPRKQNCTDSNQGREIELRNLGGLEYGMRRFHRGVSLTLLVLASLILVVELVRTGDFYPRIVLTAMLALFCFAIVRLSVNLFQTIQRPRST